jgi:UDP-N-acetylglucosamine diphosphorylase/glucosamine-1-phosphate N-acetyltransferase
MNKLCVTILAGGVGKRMQSTLPKVLHCVNGSPMIVRIIKQVLCLEPAKIIIVVGKSKDLIKAEIEKYINDIRIEYADQTQPLGTAHAVASTINLLDDNDTNIILNGDTPLLQWETINSIYKYYLESQTELLITSIKLDNPTGNGRIVVKNNTFEIIEEKDCTDIQREIKMVNCGIYIMQSDMLKKYVMMISNDNAQNEYYLTDIVSIYNKYASKPISLFVLDPDKRGEVFNVNSKNELAIAEQISS